MNMGNRSGTAVGSSSARATIGASHTATGRAITCDDEYTLAFNWSCLKSRDELVAYPACDKFLEKVRREPSVAGEPRRCFRGRALSIGKVPEPSDMGPPPEGTPFGGERYNYDNQSVLYMSDCEAGVLAELRGRNSPIWVQTYIVPLTELRIADLSTLAAGAFVNQVFWFAELAGSLDQPVEFAFSRLIAELVGREFDGMIVPGIRGDNGFKYRNIVVFRPHLNWKHWLEPNAAPYQLP